MWHLWLNLATPAVHEHLMTALKYVPFKRRPCVRRAYETVKAHQTAEAARRAEEERLTNLLYAEEVEVRAAPSAYWPASL